jgi:hypothetical protein
MSRLLWKSLGPCAFVLLLGALWLSGQPSEGGAAKAPGKIIEKIDPLTHKKYTETIPDDKVKVRFDLVPIPGGT